MAFDYNSNLNAVYNALKDYNTTTASIDLSGNLDVRINDNDIYKSDPTIVPIRSDRLPAIYVLISSADESMTSIGATGSTGVKKQITVNYKIYGIYAKYGGHSPHSELLSDVYTLAQNIQGIFENEYKLSNTALWCNTNHIDFEATIPLSEGTAKAVLIDLQAVYFFR